MCSNLDTQASKTPLFQNNVLNYFLVGDSNTNNNTNISVNKNVESSYEGGKYYFSLAQDHSEVISVYGSLERFALAMFQHPAPTLLAYAGTYSNITDVPFENILPFAFPFGIGGPKMKQRVQVSLQLCIQLYLQVSPTQFMEGPTILVINHICNRQTSYDSGVMTCRSTVNGVSLDEKLSKLTVEDFELVQENNTDNLHENRKGLSKSISTSCKALGHTDKQQSMLIVAVLQCWIITD